ncbi:MAG: LPS export ABC transporter periplasmic protein LptC [Bacteroidota bacterium]|nr:LPS export ABC transporter periplasmic protein LptC [Bacteroidota bacterium]
MVQKKKARVITLILLTLVSVLITVACKKNDVNEVNQKSVKEIPKEVSTDVEILYSDSGIVKARLKTKKMIRTLSDDPTLEMKDGLVVKFYEAGFVEKSKLTANRGIRNINTGVTVVYGDVVVGTPSGDTLSSEELNWNQAKAEVSTDKMVKIKTKKEIIIAEGFKSDIGFKNYEFYKVRGRVPLNP